MSDSWKLWFYGMGLAIAVTIPYMVSYSIANKRQEKVNEDYVKSKKN